MAVAYEYKIYLTTDGGNNWSQTYLDTNYHHINDVKVFSPNYAIAVGAFGTVIIYNGSAWIQHPLGMNKYISAIYMIDDSTGYAVGWNGLFMKTVHGGTSWTIYPPFTTKDLQGIHGLGSNIISVIGYEAYPKLKSVLHPWFSYRYRTVDGGLHWEGDTIPSELIYSVFLVNNIEYIGGDIFENQSSFNSQGFIHGSDPWSFLIPPGAPGINNTGVGSISMITANEGFAAGCDVICRRKNGNWYYSPNPKGPNNCLHAVDCLTDTIMAGSYSERRIYAWAVGDNGTVLKYQEVIAGTNDAVTEADELPNIFPNPSNGIFELEFPFSTGTQATVTVKDCIGREIFNTSLKCPSRFTLDLKDYDNGLYMAVITMISGNKERQSIHKLIKHD